MPAAYWTNWNTTFNIRGTLLYRGGPSNILPCEHIKTDPPQSSPKTIVMSEIIAAIIDEMANFTEISLTFAEESVKYAM